MARAPTSSDRPPRTVIVSHPLTSGHAPEWACEWGQDKYGVFVGMKIAGVKQRFRYIPPGKFLMGSPENEPDRVRERETQHEVILTRGLWLADTTVTQELWQAVMGENPSEFKGAKNPVENVSFEDVERFLARTHDIDPRLDLRLPTEAEWEHACRAGTSTPYSFGATVTPEQVNYNLDPLHLEQVKSSSRKKSVNVKSLPANPWGLFEMHGNVAEWCSNWGDLRMTGGIDPAGPSRGSYRALRGGSWVQDAASAKSNARIGAIPSRRSPAYSVRLARDAGSGRAR